MSEPAIVLEDIALTLSGQPVLSDLNLALPGDGITAVMGPNGAGKSLCLRLIAGLLTASAGSVRFPRGAPDARDIALVFQRPVMLRRTVRGNLVHALKSLNVPLDRTDELLQRGGLDDLADRPARRLSGGEQQRLATIRAVAGDPAFLLMDEPTASLDPAATRDIEHLIRSAAVHGTKVVLVTHDRGQAARLADDIAILHRGRVAEHGDAKTVLETPNSAEARAYLAGALLD